MKLLDGIEKKLRRFALPNITLYLIVGQSFFYLVWKLKSLDLMRVMLIGDRVLDGEVWRLVTFIFIPPLTNLLFAFFGWYLFYIMGTALEKLWGTARYNLYLLIAYVASVAVCFISPEYPATNVFIGTSVFLAFAFLNPNFQLYIFFILPVKIKWLALLTWIGYIFTIVMAVNSGNWLNCLLVLAAVSNFFLFFHDDIRRKLKSGRKRMKSQTERFDVKDEPFHVCAACGITDKTHPGMAFRYCSKCSGGPGYCTDHIDNHEHV